MTTTTTRTVSVQRESCRFVEPFKISGYTFDSMPSVRATITTGEATGRGEAAGVYYLDDGQDHMLAQIETVREAVEGGASRDALQKLLPAGGARNALDCALWELDARNSRTPVWQLAGIDKPKPRVTTFTLPADDLAKIERLLGGIAFAKAIKLKLEGNLDADSARLALVRRHRPDTWLMVDANQGYQVANLDALERVLVEHRVDLLEQPLPRGDEAALEGWRPPFPVAADESILDLAELRERGRYFDMINIKLDKCGGLTEALQIARESRAMGKKLMVGNMAGSTLAMAPAFVVGQLCDVVDLDGPFSMADDPLAKHIYSDGEVFIDEALWGFGTSN